VVDEGRALAGDARGNDASEQKGVVGDVDRLVQLAVEMRERTGDGEVIDELRRAGPGAVVGDRLLALREDAYAEAPGPLDRVGAGRRGAERDEHQRRIGRDGGESGHRQAPGAAADAARHEHDSARQRAHCLGELGSRHGGPRRLLDEF